MLLPGAEYTKEQSGHSFTFHALKFYVVIFAQLVPM